jgi:hypothetical protein
MTRVVFLACLLGGMSAAPGAAQLNDPIATAVLPPPDTLRAGATVVNYDEVK